MYLTGLYYDIFLQQQLKELQTVRFSLGSDSEASKTCFKLRIKERYQRVKPDTWQQNETFLLISQWEAFRWKDDHVKQFKAAGKWTIGENLSLSSSYRTNAKKQLFFRESKWTHHDLSAILLLERCGRRWRRLVLERTDGGRDSSWKVMTRVPVLSFALHEQQGFPEGKHDHRQNWGS